MATGELYCGAPREDAHAVNLGSGRWKQVDMPRKGRSRAWRSRACQVVNSISKALGVTSGAGALLSRR